MIQDSWAPETLDEISQEPLWYELTIPSAVTSDGFPQKVKTDTELGMIIFTQGANHAQSKRTILFEPKVRALQDATHDYNSRQFEFSIYKDTLRKYRRD